MIVRNGEIRKSTLDDDLYTLFLEPTGLFDQLVSAAGLDPAKDFRARDLSDVSFRGADLSGFDFSGSNLAGTELRRARRVDASTQFAGAILDDEDQLWNQRRLSVRRDAEPNQAHAFDVPRDQLATEAGLRRAIEEGQLTLLFQPIYRLDIGRIDSFETLVRFIDDDGVVISPSSLIPLVEESGLIITLGRWVMDEALATLAEWDAAHNGDCGVKVAVNLSAAQLQGDEISGMVKLALERHGIEGSRLTVEFTESALIADPDRTAQTMKALKGLGVTLAMDDFGTGYSSLSHLQMLPIDILKIDRSFVTGMLASRDNVAIVRAVLSLAQALGMQTTAEGIESDELGQTLAALGCTYGQGYFYARPLPKDAAFQLLTAREQLAARSA